MFGIRDCLILDLVWDWGGSHLEEEWFTVATRPNSQLWSIPDQVLARGGISVGGQPVGGGFLFHDFCPPKAENQSLF